MSRVVSPEDSACFIPGRYSRSYWINSKDLIMKKMLSTLALSVFIAAGITGCGGEAPAPKKEEKKAAAPAAPTGGKEAAKEAPKK